MQKIIVKFLVWERFLKIMVKFLVWERFQKNHGQVSVTTEICQMPPPSLFSTSN
jgi:hypothetical protein